MIIILRLNDLTHKGGLTAIRIEGPSNSVDQRLETIIKRIKSDRSMNFR